MRIKYIYLMNERFTFIEKEKYNYLFELFFIIYIFVYI
jgi:hypothetical protein